MSGRPRPSRTVLALLAALVTALLAAAPADAQVQRASLPDVEDEVLCVTCGIPLNISEAPAAERQREEIRRLVERGLTKEEIKTRLVEIYGPRVLAVKPGDGAGRVGWLLPAAGILAALFAVGALALRWRGRREPDPPDDAGATGPAISEAQARRLADDLARYD